LELGLGWRIESTQPFCLRIFGNVSSGPEKELARVLGLVPESEAALLDLSNSDGIAMKTFPLLKAFVKSHSKVIWLVSKEVRRHMSSIGVEVSMIAESVDVAYAKLEREQDSSSDVA